MIRIFVGSNDRWAEHEPVLAYSIMKHSSQPVHIEIVRPAEYGMRETGCTTFTNVRYSIPEIAGNKGYAIYLDVDMLVLGDIAELYEYRRPGRWVRLVDGADEVAVIDCAIKGLPPKGRLHQFQKWHLRQMIDDQCENLIPLHWNSEDHVALDSRLVHFTDLRCQPWFTEHPDRQAVELLERYQAEADANDRAPRPAVEMA